MLVSVIVPCYNVKDKIIKCVDSIVNQSYKKIEIILFDDCSTDDTAKILEKLQHKYSKMIRCIYSKTNCGPGGAKNEGLKYAKGKYILFVDSDDYISENYVEDLVRCALNNGDIDIVLSNFTKVDEEGNISYTRKYKNVDEAKIQKITTWGKLFKRSWLEKNKMYLPYGKVLEDILFTSQQLLCDPVYDLCDNAGYYYVFNKTSISHSTLKKFTIGSLASGTNYLKEIKKYATNKEKQELLTYFAFRYICWHLLKSGNNVGKKAMDEEYESAITFMKKEFPLFNKNKYLKFFELKHERKIIHNVMWAMKCMYNTKTLRTFLRFYANHNLEKLWPNL